MLNNENKTKLVQVNNYELKRPLKFLRVQKNEKDEINLFTIVFPAATQFYKILCSLEVERIKEPILFFKNGDEEEKYVLLEYYYDINEDDLNEAEEIIVCQIQKI